MRGALKDLQLGRGRLAFDDMPLFRLGIEDWRWLTVTMR